jgi:hypothetical protein
MPPEHSDDKRIPHIEFKKIFTTLAESAVPTQQYRPANQQKLAQSTLDESKPAKLIRGVKLTYQDRANILFVAITFVGGFFCAFYFFNRPELSSRTASWPREFLFPRPRAATQNSKIETSRRADEYASPFALNSGRLPDRGENPFARNVGLLNSSPSSAPASNGASVSSAGSGPNFGSPLAALNPTAPGGDALSQALSRGAADVARARSQDAHRTVIVMRTPRNAVSKTKGRISGHAKRTTQRALKTGAKLTSRGHALTTRRRALTTRSRGSQNSRHRLQVTNARQNRGTFAERQFVDHAGQRATNSIRSAFLNPGRELGAEHNHGGGRGGRGGRGGGGAQ